MFIQKLLSLVEHVKNAAITLRNTPGGLIVGTLKVEVKQIVFNGLALAIRT